MPARSRLLPVVLVVLVSAPTAWGGAGPGIATPINGAVDIANACRQDSSGDVVDRVEKPRAQRATGDSS